MQKRNVKPFSSSTSSSCVDIRNKKMQSSSSSPEEPTKLKSKFLLACSIGNIFLVPLCIGLELVYPFILQGVWGSIPLIFTGIFGLFASFTTRKPLLIVTLIFSLIAIIVAIICCLISIVGYTYVFPECSYEWNDITNEYVNVCWDKSGYNTNQLVLAVAESVAAVNNFIVTVLCSKIICINCCAPVDPSITIVGLHDPQQQTPVIWAIPTTTGGQLQQFQSYATLVYSPYQQQPMQQLGQHQHPHAFSTDNNKTMDLDDSPPPYDSTEATLDP